MASRTPSQSMALRSLPPSQRVAGPTRIIAAAVKAVVAAPNGSDSLSQPTTAVMEITKASESIDPIDR
jgi:hypothetical protein